MIIFGWGRTTIKRIGLLFKYLCNHCHNEAFWELTKITTWFTLFFIPIIPYSSKYFLSCPICKYGSALDQKQIDELKPIAEANQQLVSGSITKEKHAEIIAQLPGNASKRTQTEAAEGNILGAGNTRLMPCVKCAVGIAKASKFCGNCGAATTIK